MSKTMFEEGARIFMYLLEKVDSNYERVKIKSRWNSKSDHMCKKHGDRFDAASYACLAFFKHQLLRRNSVLMQIF